MANRTKFAFPHTGGHRIQWRRHTINVIRNIALVAQNHVGLVVFEATFLTDNAVVTSPASLQNTFCHPHTDTVRMIAFPALGTSNESAF